MKALLTTTLALLLTAVSFAQSPYFVGEEFQVDSSVTTFKVRTQISSDSGGNFVAVWDDNALRIGARRYQADGAAIGSEFQVNTDNVTYKGYPSLDFGPNGDLVVVWESARFGANTQDGSMASIHGQRYAADGSTIANEFQINTYTTNRQGLPGVAFGPTGTFVVVWSSTEAAGPDTDNSIQGQLFSENGNPVGPEFQINSYFTGGANIPSVDFAPSGEFVVVWQNFGGSVGDDDDVSSIQGRRLASNGAPIGADFQVNSYITGIQYAPRVATGPDSEFIVVWTSQRGDGTDPFTASVQGRRFAADGTPSGDQFQVNTYTNLLQKKPTLAINNEGEFVVTWSSGHPVIGDGGPDGSYLSIQGQHFAADAKRAGIEFQVNTSTYDNQYRSSVASLPDGHFVVAWEDQRSPRAIRGQRIDTKIFVDGFESGDTTAWSSTQ